MTNEVVSAMPDTPFKELVQRLADFGVSSLPVLDEHESLVGIVTQADLVSKEAYGERPGRALPGRSYRWVAKAAGSTAKDLMTEKVITCRPDENVREVARRMLDQRTRHIPVVDSGSLVGMVSRQDILSLFDRRDEEIASDLRRLLATDTSMPDDCHVRSSVDRGIVTLTGDVRYAWDLAIVVSMVREVEGVVDVVSHLRNREPNPKASATPWLFGMQRRSSHHRV